MLSTDAVRKIVWLADMKCAEAGCHPEAPVYTRIAAHATDPLNEHILTETNEAYWDGANGVPEW